MKNVFRTFKRLASVRDDHHISLQIAQTSLPQASSSPPVGPIPTVTQILSVRLSELSARTTPGRGRWSSLGILLRVLEVDFYRDIRSLEMKRHQGGFTLIELVMVIVILGILAASFAPSFVNLGADATTAAQAGASGAVKSALTVAVADLKANPTVTQLEGYVQGGATAVATGIQVSIDGNNYIVPTYKDQACTAGQETAAVGDTVLCVGDI